MKCVIFLLTLTLMAGCQTPSDPEETTTVPQARLFGFTETADAHLVVLAETPFGRDCGIHISIDKKPAADFYGAEVAHFGLTFGLHTLLARTSQGCSKQWTYKVGLSVKSGDALIMRIDKAGVIRTES